MIKLEKIRSRYTHKRYRSGFTRITTQINTDFVCVNQRIVQRKSASSSSKGQVVVIMLIIAMIIGVVIPALVYMSTFEAKSITKQTKSTRAFHLAEAGIDRGIFKLNESGIWDVAVLGTAIPGYTGSSTDSTYSDVEGGYYRIKFSSGPSDNQITILSSGKDQATDECRTIQAIYSKTPGVSSALIAPGISVTGNFVINWGPVSSTLGISLSGSADNFYPRKCSRGQISCGSAGHNDNDPTPCGATSGPSAFDDEFREWHDEFEVAEIPEITSDYKTDAQAYTTANPATPTYLVGNLDLTGAYAGGGSSGPYKEAFSTTFTTYYTEANCTLKSCNVYGNLIVKGNLTIESSNKGDDYLATPHVNAWKEYCVDTPNTGGIEPDNTDQNQYDGDGGYHQIKDFSITKPCFRGLIYVYGTCTASANPNIYGVVIVRGTALGGGTPTIYYDKTCAQNIKTTSTAKPVRESWKEL